MLVSQPFVSCLCPTYGRPQLLANAIACFLAQDYDGPRELLILDDAGQYGSQQGDHWQIISVNRRFQSLPAKFNALAGLARGDVLAVWEDDDIYLPWHLSTIAAAVQQGAPVAKPATVWSLHGGQLIREGAAGRFHASLAFTRPALEAVGGWPLTRRADFDQQLIGRLREAHGEPVDTSESDPRGPGYVFRWGSTGAWHGQAFMRSPADETWYDRVPPLTALAPVTIVPQFDEDTWRVLGMASRLGFPIR